VAPPNPVVAPVKPYMLSCPPVAHVFSNLWSNFWYRRHALDTHTPNFHTAAISRFPNFQFKFSLFWAHFSGYFFHFDFFHSGRMAKCLPGQSEEYIQKGLTNTKKLQAKKKGTSQRRLDLNL